MGSRPMVREAAMERAYNLTAIPCGTCAREHSGEHPPKSRPSRHPRRAGSGHGRPPRQRPERRPLLTEEGEMEAKPFSRPIRLEWRAMTKAEQARVTAWRLRILRDHGFLPLPFAVLGWRP